MWYGIHKVLSSAGAPGQRECKRAECCIVRFLTRDLDLKSPTYKVSRWSREPPVHSQTVPDSSPER